MQKFKKANQSNGSYDFLLWRGQFQNSVLVTASPLYLPKNGDKWNNKWFIKKKKVILKFLTKSCKHTSVGFGLLIERAKYFL